MATLISFGLRPQGETFDEGGNSKTGQRIYIAKYDGPVNNINDYESIGALPALYSTWDMATHNDTFCNKRNAVYKDPNSRSILIITLSYSDTDDSGKPYGELLNEGYDAEGGAHTGFREYKIDKSYVDSAEAIGAPAVPVIDQIWSVNRPGVLVVSHNSSRQQDGSYLVTANYSTTSVIQPERPENPLEEPVIYRYTSNTEEREIEVDQVTGERIEYTNKRAVQPLRKGVRDIGVWTIIRNEASASQKRYQKFRGATNSRRVTIDRESFDVDEIFCRSISADPFWDQDNNRFYRVTYVFWYDEETFRDKIVNSDTRDIQGFKYPLKSGFSEDPIALDVDGEFIDGNVAPEDRVFITPNIYKRADLQALGL